MFKLANKVVACVVLAILAFSVIAAAFPTETDDDSDEIEPFLEFLSEGSPTTSDETGGQQQQQVPQLQRRLSYYFTLQQQRYIRRLLAKLKLKYKGYELQQKLKEEFLHEKQDSDEEIEQSLEEDSDEETTPKTLELESHEETTQQTPEEDSKEATTEKPKGDSEEKTTKKPEDDSNEVTTQTPEEDSQEVTTPKPEEDSKEKTTQRPKEESEEETTQTPEDSNEETTLKPKQDSEEETTLNPQKDSEEETTSKPKEDSEDETTLTPKEDSEEETTSKPKEESEEETTLKPKEDSEEETTSKPIEDSEEETTQTPDDSNEETTLKPKQDSEEETTLKPKEDSEEETTSKPKEDSEEETTLKPEEDSKEETTLKPKEDSSEVVTDKPEEDSKEETTTKAEDHEEDSEEIDECEDYSEEEDNNSSEERSTPSTTTAASTSTTAAPTSDAPTTTTTNAPACVGYQPHEDISYYLQFDGMFWIKKSCPYGLGFDYNFCACSVKLERSTAKTVQQTTSTEATTSTSTTTTPTTTTTPATTTTTTTQVPTTPTTPETTSTTPSTTTTASTTPETTTTVAPASTTTSTTTTVTPSLEICNNCVVVNGVGYAPVSGQCDVFIQCQFFGHVPTAASIRRCPGGQFWNQDKLTCDFQENVKCTQVNKCPNHRAVIGDWSAYEIFDGQRWVRLACPAGTMYNSVTCGCTDKQNHDDSSAEDNCLDKKVIDGDRSGFMQQTAGGWVRMPCPATLGYSQETCRCTDKIEPAEPYSRCPDKKSIAGDRFGFLQFTGLTWLRIACPAKLVYSPEICTCNYDLTGNVDTSDSSEEEICRPTLSLTFDQDDASDSSINHFYVKNKGVTFRDGRAHFNGRSRLVVPGLSNMELGSSVYIQVKFMHTGMPLSPQTLLANGICQVRPSVAICSSNDSLEFYADTPEQTYLVNILAARQNEPWRTAVFRLEDGALDASVGTRSLRQPIKGALDRRHRGLIIGAGGNCSNFQGVIEEIHVYRCQPKL